MTRRPAPRGLASRFFLAQLLVVVAGILAAAVVTSVAGPLLFHEHLLRAGAAHDPVQVLHVERAYRDTSLWTLGVALATALVCALGVAWWLARRVQRPVEALTGAARAMARGQYATRVPAVGGGTEAKAVADSFNTMAAQLERTEQLRRRMLSDLAHEMRTPVSVLTVYLEALQDGVARWDEATGEVLTDQLDRLTRLVEDIHDVSRAEEGRMELEQTEVPLREVLRAAAEAHRDACGAKGVELHVAETAAAAVRIDRQRMGQVLGNLLSNALRHTPAGGTVTLRAMDRGDGRVAVQVEDTGEGIAAEQLPHVFERFWRGDTARDRDSGGSGVGLTISKALVEAHGGTLTADSPGPGGGAVFTVELPTAEHLGSARHAQPP